MKAHTLLSVIVLFGLLTACGGSQQGNEAPLTDTTELLEGSAEETQRFLDQEGDIISDESLDTLPAPEDLPDAEDNETDLPPIED